MEFDPEKLKTDPSHILALKIETVKDATESKHHWISAIKLDPFIISKCPWKLFDQNDLAELWMIAVKIDGMSFKYMTKQIMECIDERDSDVFDEICHEAVKSNYRIYPQIPDKYKIPHETNLAMIQQEPAFIQFVDWMMMDINKLTICIKTAFALDGMILRLIDQHRVCEHRSQSDLLDIFSTAVKNNGLALQHIQIDLIKYFSVDQIVELYKIAIKQNVNSVKFIEWYLLSESQKDDLFDHILKCEGYHLLKITTPELDLKAVKYNPKNLRFVAKQTFELCKAIIYIDGSLIYLIREDKYCGDFASDIKKLIEIALKTPGITLERLQNIYHTKHMDLFCLDLIKKEPQNIRRIDLRHIEDDIVVEIVRTAMKWNFFCVAYAPDKLYKRCIEGFTFADFSRIAIRDGIHTFYKENSVCKCCRKNPGVYVLHMDDLPSCMTCTKERIDSKYFEKTMKVSNSILISYIKWDVSS